VAAAATLLIVIFYRATRSNISLRWEVVVAHSMTVLLTAGGVFVFRPAHIEVTVHAAWQRLFSTPMPTDLEAWWSATEQHPYTGAWITYLDPLTLGSLGSLALIAIACASLVFATVIANWVRPENGSRPRRHSAGALGGVVVAVASAVLVFLSAASALRLALENILGYLGRHFFDDYDSGQFAARGLLPYQLPSADGPLDDWIVDLFPLLSAMTLLIVCLSGWWASSRRGAPAAKREERESTGGGAPARVKAVWIHAVLTDLAATLIPTVAVALVVTVPLAVLALNGLLDVRVGSLLGQVLGVLAQVVSVLAITLLVAGRNHEKIRPVLGAIADVVGFWPIAGHPLAGLSYRDAVVAGIADELARPRTGVTVLTGHSQGSVLSAWTLGTRPPIGSTGGVLLVTCGSPLDSLYRTLFPGTFDDQFFGRVREHATAGWFNMWRDTDPIATELTALSTVENVQIPDPEVDGVINGHSDYWSAAEQLDRIDLALA